MKSKNLASIIAALSLFGASADTSFAGGKNEPVLDNKLNNEADYSQVSIHGPGELDQGIEENSLFLPQGSYADINLSTNIANKGAISFWFKPEFDINSPSSRRSYGLAQLGPFSGANSIGAWAHKSQWGPVIIFETKESPHVYRQAWSNVVDLESNKWHHVAFVFDYSKSNEEKRWAQVYVNGRPGTKNYHNLDIDLSNADTLRIGNIGWYGGYGDKSFDTLKVFPHPKTGKAKRDYRKYKNFR